MSLHKLEAGSQHITWNSKLIDISFRVSYLWFIFLPVLMTIWIFSKSWYSLLIYEMQLRVLEMNTASSAWLCTKKWTWFEAQVDALSLTEVISPSFSTVSSSPASAFHQYINPEGFVYSRLLLITVFNSSWWCCSEV